LSEKLRVIYRRGDKIGRGDDGNIVRKTIHAAIIAGDFLTPDTSEDGAVTEADGGNLVGMAMATIADNATGLCCLMIGTAA